MEMMVNCKLPYYPGRTYGSHG